MKAHLELDILPQPDDTTCGPTCLHAIYNYFEDDIPLERIIEEHRSFKEGGTIAVFLACHALRRGYKATIYTYNLHMFDPSWFLPYPQDIAAKLREQVRYKTDARTVEATQGYLEFLELGGKLKYEVLNSGLIRRFLKKGIPILSGLSSTYLYQTMREFGIECLDDDIRGVPAGHFVILCGYDKDARSVTVADPLHTNPVAEGQYYTIDIDRVICSILLGVLTHDANLLIIEPGKPQGRS